MGCAIRTGRSLTCRSRRRGPVPPRSKQCRERAPSGTPPPLRRLQVPAFPSSKFSRSVRRRTARAANHGFRSCSRSRSTVAAYAAVNRTAAQTRPGTGRAAACAELQRPRQRLDGRLALPRLLQRVDRTSERTGATLVQLTHQAAPGSGTEGLEFGHNELEYCKLVTLQLVMIGRMPASSVEQETRPMMMPHCWSRIARERERAVSGTTERGDDPWIRPWKEESRTWNGS